MQDDFAFSGSAIVDNIPVAIFLAQNSKKETPYSLSGGNTTSDEKEITSESFQDFMLWLTNKKAAGVIPYKFSDNDFYYIYRAYISRLQSAGKIAISGDCVPENKSKENSITYDGTNWCEITLKESIDERLRCV